MVRCDCVPQISRDYSPRTRPLSGGLLYMDMDKRRSRIEEGKCESL